MKIKKREGERTETCKTSLATSRIIIYASNPVTIHHDSMNVLAYTRIPKYNGKTKYIQLRYYFIKDIVAQKQVTLKHIFMSQMVVDPLIKCIAQDLYVTHIKSLEPHRM